MASKKNLVSATVIADVFNMSVKDIMNLYNIGKITGKTIKGKKGVFFDLLPVLRQYRKHIQSETVKIRNAEIKKIKKEFPKLTTEVIDKNLSLILAFITTREIFRKALTEEIST